MLVVIWGLLGLCASVASLVAGASRFAVSEFISWVARLLSDLLVGGFIAKARSHKLAHRHKAEVGLRVVDGHQPGLGPRWRHGVGTLASGRLEFRGTVGGVRFLRRAPITIAVTQIHGDAPRTTGLPEAWSVMPGTKVVQLVTPTARLEWAVPGPQIDWAIEELLPLGDTAGGS